MNNYLISILYYNFIASIPFGIWYLFHRRYTGTSCIDSLYTSLRVASVLFFLTILYGYISEYLAWALPHTGSFLPYTPFILITNFILFVLVLIGAICQTLRYIGVERKLYREYSRQLLPASQKTLGLVAEEAARLGLSLNHLQIKEGYCILSAELAGYFRPILCLSVDEYPELSLRQILLHELIHYKYKDKFFSFLSALSVCICWYNPVSYLIFRTLQNYDEFHCDQLVCHYTDKNSYAGTLLSMGTKMQERESLSPNDSSIMKLCFLETHSFLVDRIKKLFPEADEPKVKKKLAAVICLVMCLLLPAAAYGLKGVKSGLEKRMSIRTMVKVEDNTLQEDDQWIPEEETLFFSFEK